MFITFYRTCSVLMDIYSSNPRPWTIRHSLFSSSSECMFLDGESNATSPSVLSFPLVLKVQLPESVAQNMEDMVWRLLTLDHEIEQTVLLLWFFIASLLFSSLEILLLMPSRYTARSNKPAPNGMLEGRYSWISTQSYKLEIITTS